MDAEKLAKSNRSAINQLAAYAGKPASDNLFQGYTSSCYVYTDGTINNALITELCQTAIVPIQEGKTYTITVTGAHTRFRVATDPSLYLGYVKATTLLVNNPALSTYTFTNTTDRYLYVYITDDGTFPPLSITSPDHVPETASQIAAHKGTMFGAFNGFYKSPTCANVSAGQTIDLAALTLTQAYAYWDALVTAYPTVITKTLLGYGSAANGTEDNTKPIYEYVIMPSNTPSSQKVLLSSGTHGNEKGGMWYNLQFITQLLSGWRSNAQLMALRNNCTFKIVPIVNPAGWVLDTRNNARNVNLARNYDYSWAAATDSDKGASAHSERETQIHKAWLSVNKNADIYIACHQTYQEDMEVYTVSPNHDLRVLACGLLKTLTAVWSIDYSSHPQEYTKSDGRALPSEYNEAYYTYGIPFAIAPDVAKFASGVAYTNGTIERGVDTLANTLLMIMNYKNMTHGGDVV